MRAVAEREHPRVGTENVEVVGTLELPWVAVPRPEQQCHLRVLRDGHAAYLHVAGGGAGHVLRRARVAQQLLDRRDHELRLVDDGLPLLRMPTEQAHPVRDEFRRRLVAARDQEHAHADHLGIGQPLTPELQAHQEAEDVVGGVCPPSGGVGGGELHELALATRLSTV